MSHASESDHLQIHGLAVLTERPDRRFRIRIRRNEEQAHDKKDPLQL